MGIDVDFVRFVVLRVPAQNGTTLLEGGGGWAVGGFDAEEDEIVLYRIQGDREHFDEDHPTKGQQAKKDRDALTKRIVSFDRDEPARARRRAAGRAAARDADDDGDKSTGSGGKSAKSDSKG